MRVMNMIICLLTAAQLLSSCKNNPADTVKTDPAPQTATGQLQWSDEFDGTGINPANWTFETGAGGWGNNEKEFYQADNAAVANGNLVITAKKQNISGSAYTSARMISKGKREFTYGRIEARIKLPLGQGQWPAFWMLGANVDAVSWPKCGEIDIMENTNTSSTVLGTLHWDNNGYATFGGNTTTTTSDYHVYRIDWTPKSITWFVDGIQFHTANIENNINGTDEFHRPFFLIFNLAIGGNLPGQTVDDTKLPASMYVDYIRVYKL